LLTMGIRGLLTWPLTVHIQNWHELLVPLQVFFFFHGVLKMRVVVCIFI
jgi:hypothetical protein